MAIKAAPTTSKKVELIDVDPDGETWVYINPRTLRMDRMRGRILNQQEFSADGRYMKVDVNPVELSLWELWITCGNENGDIGQVVVEREIQMDDGEMTTKREVYLSSLKKDDITYSQFVEELDKCPPVVRTAWMNALHEEIPEWIFPF